MRPTIFLCVLLCIGCATADLGSDCTSADGVFPSDYNFADLEWLQHRAPKGTQFAFNPFERELAGPAFMGLTCGLLVEQIGEPLNLERSEVPDRSGTYADSMITMHYNGYSVGVINYGRGYPDSAINYLEIVENTEPMKYNLEIGKSTRNDVLSVFSDSRLGDSQHGLSMTVPAIERDDRYEPPETYIGVGFDFDDNGILEKVWIR